MQLKPETWLSKIVDHADVASALIAFYGSFEQPIPPNIAYQLYQVLTRPKVPDLMVVWDSIMKDPAFGSAIGIGIGGMAIKQFAPEGYVKYGTAAQKVAAGLLAGKALGYIIHASHNPGGSPTSSEGGSEISGYGY